MARFSTSIVVLFLVSSSCAHDEFPGRLPRGCASRDECRALVAEAHSRLLDCIGSIHGDVMTYDWGRVQARCSYEYGDYRLATQKAIEHGCTSAAECRELVSDARAQLEHCMQWQHSDRMKRNGVSQGRCPVEYENYRHAEQQEGAWMLQTAGTMTLVTDAAAPRSAN